MRATLTVFWLLLVPLIGKELSWAQTKALEDYKRALDDLASYQPSLAVTKLKVLLTTKEINEESQKNIKLLLGEAQVRAGLASDALKNLTGNSPKSLEWRSHALIQLGKLREAERTLAKIEGYEAIRQRALILSSLDQTRDALGLLTPLLEKDRLARLQAIAAHLDLGQLDEAEELLTPIKNSEDAESLRRFLSGRLQLARGQRLAAMGTFQALANPGPGGLKMPQELIHAAAVLLVDSTALEGNEGAAVATALQFIEQNPDSPKIPDLFSRLIVWRNLVPEKMPRHWSIIPETLDLFPLPDWRSLAIPAIPNTRSAWAHYLWGLKELTGEDPRLGRSLISQLFVIMPDELFELRQRALIDLGLHHLESGRPEEARGLFSILVSEASPGEIKAIASSLEGTASFALQDPKQAAAAFSEANSIAQKFGKEQLAQTASINASLSQLQAGLRSGLHSTPDIPKANLQLERGLLYSNRNDPQGRNYLSEFVTRFNKHSRIKEARLALAESCVFTSPRAPELAATQLEGLRFPDEDEIDFEIRRITCLLELSCLLKEKMGLEEAAQFLVRHPEHPAGAEILFRQARALSSNNNSPQAFVIYEKLLDAFPESELAEPARMLSAQAAFSVGNQAAEEKAFQRYQELIASEGPLANEAALERADLRINRGEFGLALQELEPLLKKEQHSVSDQRRILILAAKSAANANQGQMALDYYTQILSQKDLPAVWFNRTSFLKGQLLESLGRPMEALDVYNKVIYVNLDSEKTSELEWEYHDRAALDGALPLLERLGKWNAAYQTALKVSQSGGPSAERAAQRAERIQLDKQLFDSAR
ncbi:MAG: hypothetical protein ACON5H_09985 [Akkermansiaceae bacterium]